METVDEKTFNDIVIPEESGDLAPGKMALMTKDDLKDLVKSHEHPVERQKELAAKLKFYIDARMALEFKDGIITDHTRRWVKLYNNLLENIQKAIYGDKTHHLHEHRVSHATIAMQMRKYDDIIVEAEVSDEVSGKDNKG